MASKPLAFSPAARLYAQNYAIVDAVRSEFASEVKMFLDALETKLKERRGERFQQQSTGAYRYWWLSNGTTEENKKPRIWLETLRPGLIAEAELRLNIYLQDATEEQKNLLSSLIELSPISDHCRKGSDRWSHYIAELPVEENSAIEVLANQVDELLEMLEAVSLKSGRTSVVA